MKYKQTHPNKTLLENLILDTHFIPETGEVTATVLFPKSYRPIIGATVVLSILPNPSAKSIFVTANIVTYYATTDSYGMAHFKKEIFDKYNINIKELSDFYNNCHIHVAKV